MHLAAARNAPHVIEYLIDESSSSLERLVVMKDNKGRTPLDIARERQHPLVVRLLQRVNPSLRTRIITLVTGKDGSNVLMCAIPGAALARTKLTATTNRIAGSSTLATRCSATRSMRSFFGPPWAHLCSTKSTPSRPH